jgi:hypothetical protein
MRQETGRAITVETLAEPGPSEIEQLAEVLVDCVEGGASVSFMQPLTRERAAAFWRKVAEEARAGKRMLIAASDGTGIVGTVQLILDLPENQPHRADVAKMLVHRRGADAGGGGKPAGRGPNAARSRYGERRCRPALSTSRLATRRHDPRFRPLAARRLL